MTGAEFTAEVLSYMDVDATRRGIATFRAAYTKAALADLAHYIPEYDTGQVTYGDLEITPYDSEVAEAVAEFLKAKITRNVDRDLGLSQQHTIAYVNLRRRLFLRNSEERTPELRPFIGKLFQVSMGLRLSKFPCPIIANVWFTVKRFAGEPDSRAVIRLQRGEGIEILDANASRIRITLTADQTNLLTTLREYYWDVQVEDANHNPVFPVNGMLVPRQPVTQRFDDTIMLADGTPWLTAAGVPVAFAA
jgi:hypothetical protein